MEVTVIRLTETKKNAQSLMDQAFSLWWD